MTAREMFEKLGFTLEVDVKEYTKYKNGNCSIVFDKLTKEVLTLIFYINMQVLKAINKQVEELGWQND